MRYILIILSLLLYSCDDSTTEAEDIVDCCHEWAWNYNHETTQHDDSLCIFNFGFSYPTGGQSFNADSQILIEWGAASSVDETLLTSGEEPGNPDISISLSVVDSDTEEVQFVIPDCTENTFSCVWTIELIDGLVAGDKKLSILQDLNTDDTIDQDSVLSAFSSVFSIVE